MKNIRVFLSENFQFLEVKFSIYLNRRVFVMNTGGVMRRVTAIQSLSVHRQSVVPTLWSMCPFEIILK